MSVVGWNRAGSASRLAPLKAAAAARTLMAASAALAPMVTVALLFIFVVRLTAGKTVLSARALAETLAPIALAWALFGFSAIVLKVVRRPAVTPPPGSRARP